MGAITWVKSAVPSNKFPYTFLPVANLFALVDVPDKVPEITPALKPPLESRSTKVFGVLFDVAAVKLFVFAVTRESKVVIL